MARFLSSSYSAFKRWKKAKPQEELDQEVIDHIALFTDGGFTNKTTIALWYERFKKKFPKGVIPKKKLVKIYRDFYGSEDYIALANLVLDAYADNFEALDFKQFMVALYHASPGDVGRFILTFRMFDRNGDGVITKEDVRITSVSHRIRKGSAAVFARVMAELVVDRVFFMLLRNPTLSELDIYLYSNTIFSDSSPMSYGEAVTLQVEFSHIRWHVLALLAIANNLRSPITNHLIPCIPCEEPTGKFDPASDDISVDGVFREVPQSQLDSQPGCSHWKDMVTLEDMLRDGEPDERPYLRPVTPFVKKKAKETPTKILNVREEKEITSSQVSKVAIVLHKSPSEVKLEEELLTVEVDDTGDVKDMAMEPIGIQDESGEIPYNRKLSGISDVEITVDDEMMAGSDSSGC